MRLFGGGGEGVPNWSLWEFPRLPFEVRLSMTTLPVILSGPGPVTQTISPGYCSAVARVEGNTTQFQWQFDGVDLEREPSDVGEDECNGESYRAIVRNIDPVGDGENEPCAIDGARLKARGWW